MLRDAHKACKTSQHTVYVLGASQRHSDCLYLAYKNMFGDLPSNLRFKPLRSIDEFDVPSGRFRGESCKTFVDHHVWETFRIGGDV